MGCTMKIINFGSLNVDYVYHLSHIVLPGETLASSSMQVNPGGKGANQSVAMIRAGATVWHAGQLGTDTEWMRDRLQKEGIDVRHIKVSGSVRGGHAIIQVDETGQNSIVLYGGANITIEPERIHEVLADAKAGDWLVLQNEINLTSELLKAGKAVGMKVCFNPAPFAPEVFDYPLDCVDLFILNEHEAAGLAKRPIDTAPEILLDELAETYPEAMICLTLGADGSLLWSAESGVLRQFAYSVTAVDTTAAGDTFTGYFLAELTRGSEMKTALDVASRAASIAVTRAGAMDSIPFRKELS